MRAGLLISAALLSGASAPVMAQTINGESNYEDGISHIPPPADAPPAKVKPNAAGTPAGGGAGKPGVPAGE